MKIDVLTLFPQMFGAAMTESILGRAQKSGLLEITLHNIRDYSSNKHKTTDDAPFGGGAGMVMTCQPVFDCIEAIDPNHEAHRIYMSPRGRVLSSNAAKELSKKGRLLILCGHYEGIDERILNLMDDQISIGDYVLTGGELPAMVLIDCMSRFIEGVLGSSDSAHDESFSDGLLEYPQYTRPANFREMEVPEILLGGHHAKITAWRKEQALLLTRVHRQDLFEKLELSKQDRRFLEQHDSFSLQDNE